MILNSTDATCISTIQRTSRRLVEHHGAPLEALQMFGQDSVQCLLNMGPKFMNEKGLNHVTFSTPDGALKATPAMGIVDAIVDLVSCGTTLGENNLKEIAGGVIFQIQE
ncbi:unnamed protein product [Cuscuta campestris]|uniref:ATP phosphoribosyltransferase n=1 Tax=Cuscuta campestris TaxID=132261 RepID=A0A484LVU9_9ASTE|nr:unnamed protein product [Cuscuta campestris]